MNKFLYKKAKRHNIRKMLRFTGLGISISGIIFGIYFFFPLISWELYLKPAFASQSFAAPIPQKTIITKEYIASLFQQTAKQFSGVDFNNAANWLPATYKEIQVDPQIANYNISIPRLNINNATVSTTDTDLGSHLVHFPSTAIPPARGTGVIFGHSTLPELYNPSDYHTIFANILDLREGDLFNIGINNTLYTYKIYNISIVEPDDTSYLTQQYDSSYLTIVTCTPPGTTWKRLIIKSKLE